MYRLTLLSHYIFLPGTFSGISYDDEYYVYRLMLPLCYICLTSTPSHSYILNIKLISITE